MFRPTDGKLVFKIVSQTEWRSAEARGVYAGAPVDLADGFVHFSTAAQIAETARRHFSGQEGLIAVAFDPGSFGDALRWEPSRGGDLFPHLYAPLDPAEALWSAPLPLDEAGIPIIPDEILEC